MICLVLQGVDDIQAIGVLFYLLFSQYIIRHCLINNRKHKLYMGVFGQLMNRCNT